jgi:hypothetical protein
MTKKKLIVFVVVICAIIFMLLPRTNDLREGESIQTGTIEISNSDVYRHDVLFPEKFATPPSVEIEFTSGSGYLEVVETRSDGFVFTTSNLGYAASQGAFVKWLAIGTLASPDGKPVMNSPMDDKTTEQHD